MQKDVIKSYVSDIKFNHEKSVVIASVIRNEYRSILKKYGFRRVFLTTKFKIKGSENQISIILKGLHEDGFWFLYQPHGWSPAEVMIQFREEGRIHGAINAVSWVSSKLQRLIQL
jgi:hypothetical protein